jgi:hypothetical protein
MRLGDFLNSLRPYQVLGVVAGYTVFVWWVVGWYLTPACLPY